MKKPQSIDSILEKTLKALEIDVPLKSYSIFGSWNKIVGESVALHAQPRSIRNRTLFIDVSHSTWMQQLQFLKPALLEKISASIGEPLIQDIRFRLGKISPPPQTPSKAPSLEHKKLDPATLNQIDRTIQRIEDESIKQGLREVLIKSVKLERSRKKFKQSSE